MPRRRRNTTISLTIGGQKVHLCIGWHDDGTIGEVFADMHKVGAFLRGMLHCFARLLSVALQYGVPIEKLIDMHKDVHFEPAGEVTGYEGIESARSIVDLVLRVVEREVRQ